MRAPEILSVEGGCPNCGDALRQQGGVWHCVGCEKSFALHASARDPRVNPEPGDALSIGGDVREVWDVMHGRVQYGFPNRVATRWLSLFEWQRWARNADVGKVAA